MGGEDVKILSLLKELGIQDFKDQAYLYKLINIFIQNMNFDTFSSVAQKNLNRDYSSIRQRLKRITNNIDEEIAKQILDMNIDKKELSGKEFVQILVNKISEDDDNDDLEC